MKKTIFLTLVILSTFFSSSVFAQMMVGEHLNDIKKEHPIGNLEINENYGYTFGVEVKNDDDYYLFFLNKQLFCYMTVLKPTSSGSLQAWIEALNKRWVVVDNFHWRLYRANGSIMQAELRKVADVQGMCIGFRLIE